MSAVNQAVFLSYASQDAEAARRICEALRAAGVEVWFDQSELRGGDAWDAKIRGQIKACALFVPVISANTQARTEGYFRLEWRLADQRTHLMAKGRPFLVPVVIDDTRDSGAHVPDSFLDVQWTRLESSRASEAFAERIRALLENREVAANPTGALSEVRAALATRPHERRVMRLILAATAVIAAAVAVLWIAQARRTDGTSGAAVAAPSQTRAEQLAAQAIEISQRLGHTRDDLAAADALAKEAAELDPSAARVWGVRAWVNAMFLVRAWDQSVKRREEVETLARRALALDPNEPDALTASAQVLLLQGAAPEAEVMARQADRVRPNAWRTLSVLANAQGAQGKVEQQRAVYQAVLRRDPTEVLARYDLAQSYISLRKGRPSADDVERALDELDRAIAQTPFYSAVYLKATYLAAWRGDLPGMRTMLDELAKFPALAQADDQPLHIALWGGLLERKPERTLAAAALSTRGYLEHGAIAGPKAWYTAIARSLTGQTELARAEWSAAEAVLRERLRERPEAQLERLQLAVTLAWMGRADEARPIATALEPLVRESRHAAHSHMLAFYHAASGNAAEAVPYLRAALHQRGRLTDYTLPLDPWWDRLRGKPEFEALLAEAAARRAEDAKLRSGANLSAAPASEVHLKSVAVLAFRPGSVDRENDLLCEAIPDELCNVLGQVPGLRVAASASAFSFKGKGVRLRDIAAQLGVAYLVDGTVVKVGNRVRVRAELFRAADEMSVWKSGDITHELKDMFAVGDEIVPAIAKNLQLQLGASPRAAKPVTPEAFRLYYEGRRAWSLRGITEQAARAQDFFQKAIDLDPSLGRAYAGMVDVNLELGVMGDNDAGGFGGVARFGQRDSTKFTSILALADKAVQLEPESAEAHTARGRVCWYGWRFAEAERELRLALKLNPSYADAHLVLARLLHADGRLDEALSAIQQATKLDPLTSRYFDNAGIVLRDAGRYTEALAAAERALALQPDSRQAAWVKAVALSALGRSEEAVAIARRPEQTGIATSVLVLIEAGLEAEAIKASESLRGSSAARAVVFAALGRKEDALRILTPADSSALGMGYLFYRPALDPLRSDPRFVQYLEQIGRTEAHARAQAWRAAHPSEKPEIKR